MAQGKYPEWMGKKLIKFYAAGLCNHLATNYLLSRTDDRLRRLAEMLTQRYDQDGCERKAADRQAARVLLHLRRMNAVAKTVLARKVQHGAN